MADIRALSALQALIPDNTVQAIDEVDVRDGWESTLGVVPYAAKAVNYTASDDDAVIAVTAGGGGVTITLPAVATTRVGKFYIITNADGGAGNVTVDGNSAELINGAATKTISNQYEGLLLINTGTIWLGMILTLA